MKRKVATSHGRISQREFLAEPYINITLQQEVRIHTDSQYCCPPAEEVDDQQDDADYEEDEHGRGQPHHLRVVLGRELLGPVLLEDVRHRAPELHRLKRSLEIFFTFRKLALIVNA